MKMHHQPFIRKRRLRGSTVDLAGMEGQKTSSFQHIPGLLHKYIRFSVQKKKQFVILVEVEFSLRGGKCPLILGEDIL